MINNKAWRPHVYLPLLCKTSLLIGLLGCSMSWCLHWTTFAAWEILEPKTANWIRCHPNALSYCNTSIPSLYQCHEPQKKQEYDYHIREVEQASFTPLVFSTTGVMGREAIVFYRRLANHLSHHSSMSYSQTLAFIWYAMVNYNVHLCIAPPMPPLRWTACTGTTSQNHLDFFIIII